MITTWDAANSVRMPALLFFIRFVASKAMQEQHLSDFDFELPPELIAQYPLADRAASRLLHITEEVIEDCIFGISKNSFAPAIFSLPTIPA